MSYKAMSEKSKMWLVGLAAIIALTNLVLAWIVVFQTQSSMTFKPNDVTNVQGLSQGFEDQGEINGFFPRYHATNTVAHLKGINKQLLLVLSVGSGFALMAIGFALFLFGADGAFSVEAKNQDSKFILSSTAPGLLCFVLAAILIGIGITRKFEYEPGPFPLVQVENPSKTEGKGPANKPKTSSSIVDGLSEAEINNKKEKKQR